MMVAGKAVAKVTDRVKGRHRSCSLIVLTHLCDLLAKS
jgi:hypothetical protein